jgi:hypothetical protein
MMTDKDYLTALKRSTCRVLFHKADGSIRTIRGYAYPEDVLRSSGVVPIRELGTGAFKSFKADAVIEFIRDPVASEDLAAAGL